MVFILQLEKLRCHETEAGGAEQVFVEWSGWEMTLCLTPPVLPQYPAAWGWEWGMLRRPTLPLPHIQVLVVLFFC